MSIPLHISLRKRRGTRRSVVSLREISRRETAPDLVSGQAMLLTVVMTGGILFLVTSVAGILMFYQLQAMTDIGNSAAAIFAADATLEKATYDYLTSPAYVYDPANPCFTTPPCTGPTVSLSNGASGSSYLVIPPPGTANATTTITAEGRGPGGRTIRLLQTTFLINP